MQIIHQANWRKPPSSVTAAAARFPPIPDRRPKLFCGIFLALLDGAREAVFRKFLPKVEMCAKELIGNRVVFRIFMEKNAQKTSVFAHATPRLLRRRGGGGFLGRRIKLLQINELRKNVSRGT